MDMVDHLHDRTGRLETSRHFLQGFGILHDRTGRLENNSSSGVVS